MTGPAGEMPFLDHLEELRMRIIWSLVALAVGIGVGFWVVQHFQLVSLLKIPIAPYLANGGKLTVLSPTEPVMIVFKLSLVVGLVLASPVVFWQVWAFLAPALYGREKRVLVPALFAGAGLFILGGALAWIFVVPKTLEVLFSFQSEAIAPMITYDAYFDFIVQVVVALGISFELPLVMIILAWLGIVTPGWLNRFRRYAVVLACVAGAILSPGTDVLSMIMMTLPLLVLYEVGVAGAVIVNRRKRKRAAASAAVTLLLVFLGASRATAQNPIFQQPSRGLGRDTARVRPSGPIDTARARRAGIPSAPTLTFPEPDSVMRSLMDRPGYTTTHFRSDSARLFATDKRVELEGSVLTDRQGVKLEAGSVQYREDDCTIEASGKPHLFDKEQVLLGEGISYNTCRHRGVIRGAFTNFNEQGTVWFLRGNVASDSSSTRLYAASSEITSCDLPMPHYHFAAREVKWVSNSVIVARPVVLYVRDVPILWLPFIFQDTRPGRHSGILTPQFGLNDIVRTSSTYNRQLTNLGYYWAISDYADATFRVDWYSGRYLQAGVGLNYRILNRFMNGTVNVSRQWQNGGGSANGLHWTHQQAFSLSTSLNFDVNYLSNSTIVRQNALDPLLNTQQITSSLNLTRRYGWGSIALGGNRRQNLSDNSSNTQLPSLTITPKPLDFGRNLTWSPGMSITNDLAKGTSPSKLFFTRPDGQLDSIAQTSSTRVSALNFDTPLRLGSFNWRNSLRVVDNDSTGRQVASFREPDPTTPDPNDSITVNRTVAGGFASSVDWDTGINLPLLFRSSWKLQPTVAIQNSTPLAPFAVRNQNTGGQFVRQGKRPSFSLSVAPTFYRRFGGIGPFAAIRHSISPQILFNYQPAATISPEFAAAIGRPGGIVRTRSDPLQTISLILTQTFEGKSRPRAGDTLGLDARKYRLLSISTSQLSYDFEQAKQPERTGWTTQFLTNSLLSDLLPGFSVSLTHDLWRGVAGTDTAAFSPFLSQASASFALSSRTFRTIGSFFGLLGRREREPGEPDDARLPSYTPQLTRPGSPGQFANTDQIPLSTQGRGFNANVNYSLTRRRPDPNNPQPLTDRGQQSVGLSTIFSPTPFWAVSWQTQYNITDKRFESHVVRLERDLHEWRAAFNFVRNANGNVAFYFSIFLTDLPQLKFDYDQTTLGR
jgi:Tat protein translocase TatC